MNALSSRPFYLRKKAAKKKTKKGAGSKHIPHFLYVFDSAFPSIFIVALFFTVRENLFIIVAVIPLQPFDVHTLTLSSVHERRERKNTQHRKRTQKLKLLP